MYIGRHATESGAAPGGGSRYGATNRGTGLHLDAEGLFQLPVRLPRWRLGKRLPLPLSCTNHPRFVSSLRAGGDM